jgi:hypothetical protein
VTLVPSDSLLLFTNRRLCDDLDRTTQAIYSPRRRGPIYLTVDMWPTPEPYHTIFNDKVRGDTPCTQVSLDLNFEHLVRNIQDQKLSQSHHADAAYE